MTAQSRAPQSRALIQIHFCVVLWGFTAILGKLISLPALPLVWWRTLLVAIASLCLPATLRGLRTMSVRSVGIYAGIGAVVALHWLTFYGSIKLANASIAATCMALAPVFLAFVDPWIARRAFDWREVLFGVAVVPGVALVVGGTPSGMRTGIVVGAISAFLVSIFSSLNKRFVHGGDPLSVTCIEMAAGTVVLTLFAPLLTWFGPLFVIPSPQDAVWLALLSLGCTLLPFTLSLVALRSLSAFTVQLSINLEPLYAIALAAVIFGEQRELSLAFYIGVIIVVGVVFAHPLIYTLRRSISR